MIWLWAAAALAQDPVDTHGQWRTVTTEHYRLHYPVEAEGWATVVAGQLEPIRARVAEAVGHEPTAVVDIVVMDPFRGANGFALPIVTPRMGLFTTPPDADPSFGWYRSWAEELVVHEDAHLVHLLRPSRNPVRHLLLDRMLGLGPVAAKSPAWVVEGYATVIEGRLTPLGRPNSDFRATLLRTWALEGRLPTYGTLDGSSRWMGHSARYLVGSAFLEWLEERRGTDVLPDLWARMSAREDRSFADAFEGVFGDRPEVLYARFTAELAHEAIVLERQRPVVEGAAWMDLSRNTSAVAVSPDGTQLAAVVRQEGRPSELRVWDLDPGDAEQKWQERIDELLEKDPEDVAPLRPESFPREAVAVRKRSARPPTDPRWTSKGLLFATWTRNAGGWYRPDLVRWDPETGREERITRGEDIVSVDAHDDDAIGVRSRWGNQQLVRIDLATGQVTALTDPDAEVVWSHPRLHPDGSRFAVLRNRGIDGWELVIRTWEGAEEIVDTPGGSYPTTPAWTQDGRLVYSLGQDGFFDLVLDGERVTRARGAAFAPEPAGDGLFYLSMDGDGLDIRHLETPVPVSPGRRGKVAPVVRPTPPPYLDPPVRTEVTAERYGLGRQEFRALLGGSAGPGAQAIEPVLRMGDVVGRTDWVLAGSVGRKRGWDGVSLAGAYAGLPVRISAQGFAVDDDGWRTGVLTRLDATRKGHRGHLTGQAGAWLDAPMDDTEGAVGGRMAWATLQPTLRASSGRTWTVVSLRATGRVAERSLPFALGEASAEARLGVDDAHLGASWTVHATDASPADQIRLGGLGSTVVPDAWIAPRVLAGALPPGDDVAQAYDRVRAELGSVAGAAFAERHRLCDALDCGGTSLVGLDTQVALEAIGMGRIPGSEVEAGVACTVELPDAAVERPCRSADHYSAWLRLSWRP